MDSGSHDFLAPVMYLTAILQLIRQTQCPKLEQLQQFDDAHLSAIAEKSLKEVTYHQRWSSEWVIRLGDGTNESHQRMLGALENIWEYTGELFVAADYEKEIGIDPAVLKEKWMAKVQDIFRESTIPVPAPVYMQEGGKQGRHSEHLGYILTELQYLQRAYPGSEW
ncbi:putative phenylacetate-CoA oxygenase, PaaI subunit [Ostertagia ostertagi]